jgi:hypothetical protein
MKVPEFQLSAEPFHPAKEPVEHIPQHVSTVKGNHGDQVREAKQNVDPSQPEEQMSEQQQHLCSKQGSDGSVIGREQRFLKRVNSHSVQFKRNEKNTDDVERK